MLRGEFLVPQLLYMVRERIVCFTYKNCLFSAKPFDSPPLLYIPRFSFGCCRVCLSVLRV